MVDSNDDQPERHALLHNDIQRSNNSRPSLVQKSTYLPHKIQESLEHRIQEVP